MVTSTVLGGRHHGASFMPHNGVVVRAHVETQIVEVRPPKKRDLKRDMEIGFRMIADRRKRKHKID